MENEDSMEVRWISLTKLVEEGPNCHAASRHQQRGHMLIY
jgi:hypothetical protein